MNFNFVFKLTLFSKTILFYYLISITNEFILPYAASNSESNANDRKVINYDVVIIGAGMSGLSAAQYLIENGMQNVIVFEAQNRTGGRVHTVQYKTGPIEMGAQWIHGASLLNMVYNLANRHNLIKNESCLSEEGPFLSDNGKLVTTEFLHDVYHELENIDPPTDRKASFEEYYEKHFKKILRTYKSDEIETVQQIMNAWKVLRMFDEGDELSLISSKSDYITIPCDVDLNSGLYKVLDTLIDDIGESKIKINHEVINVRWNPRGNILTVKNNGYTFHVRANHVICTVSLGVLKGEWMSMFTPKLPSSKVSAIENLHFGRGVKIFLYYDQPFWKRNALNYLTLGINDKDYANPNHDWLNRVSEVEELPGNENVLLTVALGNGCEKIETMNNVEIGNAITERFRNYSGDPTIPEPNDVIKSGWIHNKFFRGVYSSPSPRANGNEFDVSGKPLPFEKNHVFCLQVKRLSVNITAQCTEHDEVVFEKQLE